MCITGSLCSTVLTQCCKSTILQLKKSNTYHYMRNAGQIPSLVSQKMSASFITVIIIIVPNM